MPSREDCLDEVARKAGKSRAEVEDIVEEILNRSDAYEGEGYPAGEAYERARDELLENLAQQSALNRREVIMNRRKDILRQRYYREAIAKIENLPAGRRMLARLKIKAAQIAFEAKLVGTNVPFWKGRDSVDAQYIGFQRRWIGGLAKDLADGRLLKIFASRAIEDRWIDELFELNKRPSAAYERAKAAGDAGERDVYELDARGQGPGNPGVTKDAQALAIAKIVQKWQRESMASLNRKGAWIRSYSGYITRTSHSPDSIGHAGQEKWVAETLPRLDLVRTFGTRDPQRARDALRAMFTPMATGDHFDYGKPLDEPLYPTPAATASASRELHFKTGKDWRAYNEKYGVTNPTHTVVQALRLASRRAALIQEFGTRPREAYESDKQMLLGRLQNDGKKQSAKLGALEEAYNSAAAGSAERARLEPEMATLREGIVQSHAAFDNFKKWLQAFDNRFAQIDGTSMKPINRVGANVAAGIMSAQRSSKLGHVIAAHLAALPAKAIEARFWGVPFAERYRALFSGLTGGAEGSPKRAALDATLVGFQHELNSLMNSYDVADAPAGWLHQNEEHLFKLTGMNALMRNQVGGFEAMAASVAGRNRGLEWGKTDRELQRVFSLYGLGEREWKALNKVDWSTPGDGRTYLFPSDPLKLSDDQVKAYLKEGPQLERAEPSAEDIAEARERLGTQLGTAYADRAGYAVPMPSARTRAILFGKDYEPGSGWNIAKKLLFQFKQWPVDMMMRAWGREIYGRIGDGKLDRVASLVETAVGAIVFGVAAEGLKDLTEGKDPLAKLQNHPIGAILAGAQRSGMGAIVGDYLLGQFDRHGLSAVGDLAGPTFGQMDLVMDMLHAGDDTKSGTFSAAAMRERAASLLKFTKSNMPFMNYWATELATNVLIWHRLQEWISPGYLKRSEQRQEQLQGTHFWLSPYKSDEWLTGKRAATSQGGNWNLGGH